MGNFTDWFGRSYKGIIVVLVAVLAATLVVLAMQHVNSSRADAGATARPAPVFTSSPDQDAVDVNIPEAGSEVAFIGDSWTAGYAADPQKGYATLTAAAMGWTPKIYGASGSGYIRDGGSGAFPAYVGTLPASDTVKLVVLQGGLNDTYVQHSEERTAATDTITAVREKFPNADLVLVGPASPSGPSTPGYQDVDGTLRSIARTLDAGYVSPHTEKWLTADNIDQYIDHTKGDHPNNAGHAYYAEKLATALRAL